MIYPPTVREGLHGCDDITVDSVASVVDLARGLGLVVEEPLPLRSTNNLVLWLRPSAVVAKISAGGGRAADELAIARRLVDEGAPVVPPADGIGNRLHRVGDRDVTFWRYASQDDVTEPGPQSMAESLWALHEALAAIGPLGRLPPQTEQITDAIRALDRTDFAPELNSDERALLRHSLAHGAATLADAARPDRILHGSPHRLNMVIVDGSVRFVDFETVQRGPLEWDLAHLGPEVARRYPGALDVDALTICRLLVSATTSTWCWDSLTRGPDMRDHAEHHLAAVRSAFGSVRDARTHPDPGGRPALRPCASARALPDTTAPRAHGRDHSDRRPADEDGCPDDFLAPNVSPIVERHGRRVVQCELQLGIERVVAVFAPAHGRTDGDEFHRMDEHRVHRPLLKLHLDDTVRMQSGGLALHHLHRLFPCRVAARLSDRSARRSRGPGPATGPRSAPRNPRRPPRSRCPPGGSRRAPGDGSRGADKVVAKGWPASGRRPVPCTAVPSMVQVRKLACSRSISNRMATTPSARRVRSSSKIPERALSMAVAIERPHIPPSVPAVENCGFQLAAPAPDTMSTGRKPISSSKMSSPTDRSDTKVCWSPGTKGSRSTARAAPIPGSDGGRGFTAARGGRVGG